MLRTIKYLSLVLLALIIFRGNTSAATTEYWAPFDGSAIAGPSASMLIDAELGFGGYSGPITWTSPLTTITAPDVYKIEFPGPTLLPTEKIIGFRVNTSSTTGAFGFIASGVNKNDEFVSLSYVSGNDVLADSKLIGYDSDDGLIEARFLPIENPVKAEIGLEFNASVPNTATISDLEWLIQRTDPDPEPSSPVTNPESPAPVNTVVNNDASPTSKLAQTGDNLLLMNFISILILLSAMVSLFSIRRFLVNR